MGKRDTLTIGILFICMLLVLYPIYIKYDKNEKILKEDDETEIIDSSNTSDELETGYILNIRTKKIHKKTCGTARQISPENRKDYLGDIDSLLKSGYTRCKNCFRHLRITLWIREELYKNATRVS